MNTAFFKLGAQRAGHYLRFWRAPSLDTQAEPAPAPRLGKKILVVDDDAVILKTVSLKLMSHGYAVATAQDASAAIAAVRDERPDLVLLDLTFPPDISHGGRVTWDGFQIMSWLRGLEEAINLPFIIITSEDPSLARPRALANGAVAFFHKPIQHDDLLEIIRKTLERAERGGKAPCGENG